MEIVGSSSRRSPEEKQSINRAGAEVDPAVVGRRVLSRSASLPCLIAIERGFSTQGQLIDALRGEYAPRTVIDSLRMLCDEGFTSRWRLTGAHRGVAYELTEKGRKLLETPVRSIVAPLGRDQGDWTVAGPVAIQVARDSLDEDPNLKRPGMR